MVFTSPNPLKVKDAEEFLQRYLDTMNEKDVDALDAVFDVLNNINLPGFGPTSFRRPPSPTMFGRNYNMLIKQMILAI